jgi:hypothetical protein
MTTKIARSLSLNDLNQATAVPRPFSGRVAQAAKKLMTDPDAPALPSPSQGKPLSSHDLFQFIPAATRAQHADLQKAHNNDPSALLGIIKTHTLQPARLMTRQVLGTAGLDLAGRAVQLGMMALLLLMFTHFTGLGFLVSLGIAIGAILCVAIPGVIAQRILARKRLNDMDPKNTEAAALREQRANLDAIQKYLSSALLDDVHGSLHLEVLAENRAALSATTPSCRPCPAKRPAAKPRWSTSTTVGR